MISSARSLIYAARVSLMSGGSERLAGLKTAHSHFKKRARDMKNCWNGRARAVGRGPMTPNNAMDSDTFSLPLRAPNSGRHRGR